MKPAWPKLSRRAANALKQSGILTVRQLRRMSEADLLRQPNFGRLSLLEVLELYRPNSPSLPGLRRLRAQQLARRKPAKPRGPISVEQRAKIGSNVRATAKAHREYREWLQRTAPVLSESDKAERARAQERYEQSLREFAQLPKDQYGRVIRR